MDGNEGSAMVAALPFIKYQYMLTGIIGPVEAPRSPSEGATVEGCNAEGRAVRWNAETEWSGFASA